jgi:protein TonB
MNAMAVPPPGLTSFGAPQPARGSTRRYVGHALAISAMVHLSALACILWIQAQRGENTVTLVSGKVHVMPPNVDRFLPPPVVDTPPGVEPRDGRIVPTDYVGDLVTEQPKIDATVAIQPGAGDEPGGQRAPSRDNGSGEVSAIVDPDPSEDAFVAFDEKPVPILHPDPAYPEWARENGIDGRVVLHALVGIDGRVRRVTVIRGVPGLSEAAEDALYRWTFRPAKAGRQPVAVWIEVPFSFRL